MSKYPILKMAFNIGSTNDERIEAFELYQRAFGARQIFETTPPDGSDIHILMEINGHEILLGPGGQVNRALEKAMTCEVHFDNETDLRNAYNVLIQEVQHYSLGGPYPWATVLALVTDKNGIAWALYYNKKVKSDTRISYFHVGVAAEAFVAAQFARCGYDVSVQYGANQPEYDLVVVKGDKLMKVSVKGSQDGAWGLTQNFKKGVSYHEAIDRWLEKHHSRTVFALVQFNGVTFDEAPRLYLALPTEIADILKSSTRGRGETILFEHKVWSATAHGYGTVDRIPNSWKFSPKRIEEIFEHI